MCLVSARVLSARLYNVTRLYICDVLKKSSSGVVINILEMINIDTAKNLCLNFTTDIRLISYSENSS